MMTPKDLLTNPYICPMPWTGLMYNFDGTVKNCIRSEEPIGNIKGIGVEKILASSTNQDTQYRMLNQMPGMRCNPCYELEEGKRSFDIISDRVFYLKELKSVPMETYRVGNHELHTIDVRWTNLCNFACVYCGPKFSSRWAAEIAQEQSMPTDQQRAEFKDYVLSNVKNLKHVYLAGGEPMLMKENIELLELLKKENPKVNLRINTNLSKVDTNVFEMVRSFDNVHWIISVESMAEQYEYIRYGGSWTDFADNLMTIRDYVSHKISFNMLYFVLNFRSLFDTIHWLQEIGFHNNSFVVGPLLTPLYLNIKNLPDRAIADARNLIQAELDRKPGFLLEDGLRNLRKYLDKNMPKKINDTLAGIHLLDQRRGLDSRKIFKEFYDAAQ